MNWSELVEDVRERKGLEVSPLRSGVEEEEEESEEEEMEGVVETRGDIGRMGKQVPSNIASDQACWLEGRKVCESIETVLEGVFRSISRGSVSDLGVPGLRYL